MAFIFRIFPWKIDEHVKRSFLSTVLDWPETVYVIDGLELEYRTNNPRICRYVVSAETMEVKLPRLVRGRRVGDRQFSRLSMRLELDTGAELENAWRSDW